MDIDASFMKPDAIEKLIMTIRIRSDKDDSCNAFLDPFENINLPMLIFLCVEKSFSIRYSWYRTFEQGLCFRKSDYDITPGFRNVLLVREEYLVLNLQWLLVLLLFMKVEDVSVITSARRINNLSKQTIFDVFNYDNAYR